MLSVDEAQVARWRGLRDEISRAAAAEKVSLLAAEATRHRADNLRTIDAAQQGHIGGDMSITDVLTTLYYAVLDIDPADPDADGRDRLVLSKGHCAAALYTVLSSCGYFSPSELPTFMAPLSPLNGHPNRLKVPGVEANTGPLGHGLPIATGIAKAAKLRGASNRVFVLLGDGELQEGSNWEAFMAASHFKLDNLVAVVDRNRLQQGARTEDTNSLDPLPERLSAFGWEVREIDGHDFTQLLAAFTPSTSGRPVAVVAHTIKGKGISFMEDDVAWHHKVPSPEQVEAALKELV
ncbi:transketolase [Pseudactinotalea sp. HY160]|nr:transketolase [Pseudactinotalea sp. HY160]